MATAKDIVVGSIWGARGTRAAEITVTEVDNDLVEYAFPHLEQVFYLTKDSFLNNYQPASPESGYNKEALLKDLRKALIDLKAKGQGDRVYAMLDSMGI